jgi:hypothetical protein
MTIPEFSISADVLEINIDDADDLLQTVLDGAESAMHEIRADHSKQWDEGNAPDGKPNRNKSEYYRDLKSGHRKRVRGPNAGKSGIKVGSRFIHGDIPTILQGKLKNSRRIRRRPKEVRMVFAGQKNTHKIRHLLKHGYRLHFFTPKNIKTALKHINRKVGKDMSDKIRVRRGARR